MTSISININKKRNNVILGDRLEVLWGKPYIVDKIGDISYQISPLSFFQVNPYQTGKLYAKALEYAQLKGEENSVGSVLRYQEPFLCSLPRKPDLFVGWRSYRLPLTDARENARLNHMENLEFFVGKAEEVLPREYEKEWHICRCDRGRSAEKGM